MKRFWRIVGQNRHSRLENWAAVTSQNDMNGTASDFTPASRACSILGRPKLGNKLG